MTYVEGLTLITAVLAIVVAVVAHVKTTRLQKLMEELQERVTKAEEARGRLERPLSPIEEDVQRTRNADLRARIEPKNNGQRFVIENYGPARARGVQVAVEPVNGSHSPFPPIEAPKLSMDLLPAGETRSLIMVLSHQSGTAFHVEMTWTNEDGSPGRRRQQV